MGPDARHRIHAWNALFPKNPKHKRQTGRVWSNMHEHASYRLRLGEERAVILVILTPRLNEL